MTTWKSESDVLLDLDTLSGFSTQVSHPTSKAFGGSRSLSAINKLEKKEDICMMLDSKYDRIPNGRGQMIQQVSELQGRSKPGELHSQLRKACGRGYSNELIEAEFGLNSKCDFPSTDQTKNVEGVDERIFSYPSTPSLILDNVIEVEHSSTISDSSEVLSSPTKHKLFACPRQGLKKRNALLNSLYNLHHTQTIGDDSTVQRAGGCDTQTCSDPSMTSTSIPQKINLHSEPCFQNMFAKSKYSTGNQFVRNDTEKLIKKDITMSDYFPYGALANSEHSQFKDGVYSNSVELSDSDSGQISFTTDDFPPL